MPLSTRQMECFGICLAILSTAQGMSYPVNLAYLLDLPSENEKEGEQGRPSGGTPEKKSFEAAASQRNAPRPAPTASSSGSSSGSFESDGLFAEFLRLMDRAASDFSHSDFDLAMSNLGNALVNVERMEKRLQEIILARSATAETTAKTASSSSSFLSDDPSSLVEEGAQGGQSYSLHATLPSWRGHGLETLPKTRCARESASMPCN